MGYGEAFAHAALAAQGKGLKLSYITAIQMVDNYLPIFKMQEQIDTLPGKNVETQIQVMLKEICARTETSVPITEETKRRMAAFRERLALPILRKDTAQGYIVTDDCIRCGICASVCPADNITVTDAVHFSNRCEVCYACLHNCPHHAIHLQGEASPARFRNEHISLNDIINSNN